MSLYFNPLQYVPHVRDRFDLIERIARWSDVGVMHLSLEDHNREDGSIECDIATARKEIARGRNVDTNLAGIAIGEDLLAMFEYERDEVVGIAEAVCQSLVYDRGFSFELALVLLRGGRPIRRKGWDTRVEYRERQNGLTPLMWLVCPRRGDVMVYHPCCDDVLADDWTLVS